jgi:hypothetical protein
MVPAGQEPQRTMARRDKYMHKNDKSQKQRSFSSQFRHETGKVL